VSVFVLQIKSLGSDNVAKFDLREYARTGAQSRAAELQAELARIYRAFPELKGTRGASTGSKRRSRRRSTMSAAQRKAVSVRMKKYWAGRRKNG